MAVRTAVVAGLVKASRDGAVVMGAGQAADATNGNTLAAPGPYKAMIIVHNADSGAHSITIRATGNGVDATGAAQVNPAPSNVVFEGGTQGDLVQSVAAGAYELVGPFTTDRFMQADGSLSIDWSATPTATTFWLIQNPVLIPS